MSEHCSHLKGDRALGAFWEQRFCELAASLGKHFTLHQIGRDCSANWSGGIMPDVTIFTAPGEHHEVKHKNPTGAGHFGLERYRLEPLVGLKRTSGQMVFYTIHNHDLAGGRDVQKNRIEDWMTCEVSVLSRAVEDGVAKVREGVSWVNGRRKEGVPIVYWPKRLWVPLASYWCGIGKVQRELF